MATWHETVTRMGKVTDTLGKKIDQGILETVAALTMLNFCTTASCEGHIDWGIAAPWVDIDPPGDIAILRNQLQTAPKEEARAISAQLKGKQLEVLQSLSVLIAQFYQQLSHRDMEYNRILVPKTWAAGRIRLEPIGLEIQTVVPEHIKERNLKAYQAEMLAFTHFMKSLL